MHVHVCFSSLFGKSMTAYTDSMLYDIRPPSIQNSSQLEWHEASGGYPQVKCLMDCVGCQSNEKLTGEAGYPTMLYPGEDCYFYPDALVDASITIHCYGGK